MHKVPRQWLINVTYTLAGEPFNAWIKEEIASRNEDLAKKQNLLIEMDAEIAKAFHNSVNISSRCQHFSTARLVQGLTVFLLYSVERQQCPPPQGGLQASQDAGRDEGAAGDRRALPGRRARARR